MCNFLANLQNNPSYRAVTELYGFLEKGKLPITEDGYFLAYKRVRNDYTDCHTGTMSNAIGTVVEMARNQVNEDPKQTCSYGLHFCSRDYLQHFGTDSGNRTVILKINPADVVAIPADYNDTKGRCCSYEVIGELEHKNEAPLEGAFRPSDKYQAPVDDYEDDFEDDFEDEFDDETYATDEGTAAGELEVIDDYPIQASDLETGAIEAGFKSEKEAAVWAGTTASAIRRVLKGERKSTAGYRWRYISNLGQRSAQLDADMHENDDSEDDIPF
jgi:hypothetical protein